MSPSFYLNLSPLKPVFFFASFLPVLTASLSSFVFSTMSLGLGKSSVSCMSIYSWDVSVGKFGIRPSGGDGRLDALALLVRLVLIFSLSNSLMVGVLISFRRDPETFCTLYLGGENI